MKTEIVGNLKFIAKAISAFYKRFKKHNEKNKACIVVIETNVADTKSFDF